MKKVSLADDPGGPQRLPIDQPFEMWWSKYLDGVEKSVVATEQYLKVPAGTISSIEKEPDFIAMVKTYAVIEPILNYVIGKHSPRARHLGAPSP